MWQQVFAVFLVLGLLLAALWLLRRKGLATLAPGIRWTTAGSAGRKMQVIERLPLTAQHSLHLVSLPGRVIVVAVSPGGCTAIATLEAGSDEVRSL
jgi:flagellar biogenesis protein FliO